MQYKFSGLYLRNKDLDVSFFYAHLSFPSPSELMKTSHEFDLLSNSDPTLSHFLSK